MQAQVPVLVPEGVVFLFSLSSWEFYPSGLDMAMVQAAVFGSRALGRNPEGPWASCGTSWGILDLSLLTSSECWCLFHGVPAWWVREDSLYVVGQNPIFG